MQKKLLLSLIQTALFLTLWKPVDTLAQGSPIFFDRLTTRDGLSQHSVYSIYEDNHGFMWFGTLDGLNRYDGHDFQSFQLPGKSRSLNQTVHAIVPIDSTALLLATRSGLEIFHIRTETFQSITFFDYPMSSYPSVMTVIKDRQGIFWIGSMSAGVYRFDYYKNELQHCELPGIDSSNHLFIRSLIEDRQGRLWIGTRYQGLWTREAGSDQWHRVALEGLRDHEWINAIYEDTDGRKWLGTSFGLWREDEQGIFSRTMQHDRRVGNVLTLFGDHTGLLWIGTDDGLFLSIHPASPLMQITFDPQNRLNPQNRYVRCIYQDKSGILWMGSWGGLYKTQYHNKPFVSLTPDNQSNNPIHGSEILSLARDNSGRLWMAHENGVDMIRSRTRIDHFPYRPGSSRGPGARRTHSLTATHDGSIYMGTSTDITRYLPETDQWQHFPLPIVRKTGLPTIPRVLREDHEGRIWIGTQNGLYQFSLSPPHFRHVPQKAENMDIFSLALDDTSGLIVGSWEGIHRLSWGADSLKMMRAPDGQHIADAECIRYILPDGPWIWLGTRGNGLMKVNRHTGITENYTEADGLAHNWVQCILKDENENLWISTNDGLSRFNPATRFFRTFRSELGMENTEFNFGSGCRSAGGTMAFGGMGGVVIFNPTAIANQTTPPHVQFTQLELNGQRHQPGVEVHPGFRSDLALPYTRRLVIPPSVYSLMIYFSAMDYAAPSLNRYEYRLPPLQKEWVPLGNNNHVAFYGLGPGKYTLWVRGTNSDGVRDEKGQPLFIEKRPRWYQYGMFKIIMLLLAGASAYLIFRLRTYHIHKRNERLSHMVQEQTRQLSESNQKLQIELQNRRLAEARLREHSENLEKTVEEKTQHVIELQRREFQHQKYSAMGKAASTVVHEIRNPLASLKISLTALKQRLKLERQDRQCLDVAVTDVVRMEQMLKTMVEFTKPMRYHYTFDNLNNLITAILKRMELDFKENSIQVTADLQTDLPPVSMDSQRMEQALLHIFTNAVQAMPHGGTFKVKSTFTLLDGTIRLEMEDTGVGIKEEHLSQLFEPFFTSKLSGIGLGLPMARKIIQAHEGDIQIHSRLGKGSTVVITMPFDSGRQTMAEEDYI